MPKLNWQSVLQRPRDAMPLLMAHRGSSNELPENTWSAFERALHQGADVLETDIRFTRDGEIVLMHDGTVDRTANGSGVVADMTLADIRKLRAQRSFKSKQTLGKEQIPTLAEFLQATTDRDVPLALELKDNRFIEPEGAERLIGLLEQHKALERAVLLSFHGKRLWACKRVAPTLPIGMITDKNPFPTYNTELMGPLFPLLYLNPFYFAWARRRGKIACPLDPEPEPRLGFYRRLGAPVLLTNHPAVTRAALEGLG